MGELKRVYEGRVEFEVRDVNSPEGQAATKAHGWETARHGLVVIGADGEVAGVLPGHDFGKDEIMAEVEKQLSGE